MKILVTGGAGFIGSNLVDALIDEGHEVAIVDNLSTGQKENLNKKAKFFEVDITQKNKLEEVFEKVKPEAVLHLAAQASVNRSVEDPIFDVKVNVIGTINLLDLARKYDVKHFVFSSSASVYGNDALRPTPEDDKLDPVSPYGMDKLQGERFIRFYGQNSPLKTVILRYANVYGPRQNPKGEAGVVCIFTDKMLRDEPIEIYGDGMQTRDFIYVEDVVRANLLALKSKHEGTYNIGSGVETSINEVVEKLRQATGSKSQITHGPAKIEQKNSSLDARRAKLELDFEPAVQVDKGLKSTVDFFKKTR